MAIPGSVVGVGKLITPGGQQGPKGDAGTAANMPLADITQNGLLRQNTGLITDFVDGTNNCQPLAPVIWSARLRSYNAIGNPNFEVDQRRTGGSMVAGAWTGDRWRFFKAGTMGVYATVQTSGGIILPGTSYQISSGMLNNTVTTAQASLGAGDYLSFFQYIEGPNFRELASDVHSLSLLVNTNVAGLKFAVGLQDSGATRSLVKLVTVPTANVWTLIKIPNLPVWASGGNWSTVPGAFGYVLSICFACASTYTAPAADTWQNGNFLGAPGMSNLAALANNFCYIGFVQHESGSICTTFQDKSFSQNLDEGLRYYQKSNDYNIAAGGTTGGLIYGTISSSTTWIIGLPGFPKEMAKTPTATIYNGSTGAINSVANASRGGNTAVSTVSVGPKGIYGISLAATQVAGDIMTMSYAADTGM